MSDGTFTTSQAARELGMSAERVRQLARTGALPCTRTALGALFDVEEVRALAARRRRRTSTEPPVAPPRE
jgi:hypothetical protein